MKKVGKKELFDLILETIHENDDSNAEEAPKGMDTNPEFQQLDKNFQKALKTYDEKTNALTQRKGDEFKGKIGNKDPDTAKIQLAKYIEKIEEKNKRVKLAYIAAFKKRYPKWIPSKESQQEINKAEDDVEDVSSNVDNEESNEGTETLEDATIEGKMVLNVLSSQGLRKDFPGGAFEALSKLVKKFINIFLQSLVDDVQSREDSINPDDLQEGILGTGGNVEKALRKVFFRTAGKLKSSNSAEFFNDKVIGGLFSRMLGDINQKLVDVNADETAIQTAAETVNGFRKKLEEMFLNDNFNDTVGKIVRYFKKLEKEKPDLNLEQVMDSLGGKISEYVVNSEEYEYFINLAIMRSDDRKRKSKEEAAQDAEIKAAVNKIFDVFKNTPIAEDLDDAEGPEGDLFRNLTDSENNFQKSYKEQANNEFDGEQYWILVKLKNEYNREANIKNLINEFDDLITKIQNKVGEDKDPLDVAILKKFEELPKIDINNEESLFYFADADENILSVFAEHLQEYTRQQSSDEGDTSEPVVDDSSLQEQIFKSTTKDGEPHPEGSLSYKLHHLENKARKVMGDSGSFVTSLFKKGKEKTFVPVFKYLFNLGKKPRSNVHALIMAMSNPKNLIEFLLLKDYRENEIAVIKHTLSTPKSFAKFLNDYFPNDEVYRKLVKSKLNFFQKLSLFYKKYEFKEDGTVGQKEPEQIPSNDSETEDKDKGSNMPNIMSRLKESLEPFIEQAILEMLEK